MAGAQFYDDDLESIDNSETPPDELDGILTEASGMSEKIKKKFGSIDSKYIRELIDAKRELNDLNAKIGDVKKRYKNIKNIVIEQFKGAGITNQRTDDGVLISLIQTSLYSADARQRVDFARMFSREDILSVNVKTFSKVCSEFVEKKIDLPKYVKKMDLKNLMVRGV